MPPPITRRVFLRVVGTTTVAAACSNPNPTPDAALDASDGMATDAVDAVARDVVLPDCGQPFCSAEERNALAAIADYILPPDATPGGAGLGAVEYVEGLLTAFDVTPPRIWAGGPFSGRQPFANADGTVGTRTPVNSFARWLPLTRTAERGWRLRIYGSAGVMGGGPNDMLLGPTEGLRALMRRALMAILNAQPGPWETATREQMTALFNGLPTDVQKALKELVLEAALAPPEYGGNRNGAGWSTINYPGDTQPLGFSLWDETMNRYRERLDAPVSTADRTPDPAPLDAETRRFLNTLTNILGGRVAT